VPPLFGLEQTEHPAVRYQRIAKNCARAFSPMLVRQMRHVYFAMIAALDEMVGRVVQQINELGLRDSTYIIFSSDHGEMAGEQNQVLKRCMYEASAHVPLIICGPDVRRGAVVDEPVSLVDLYPTLMDMAGVSYQTLVERSGYAEQLDGESLMPQLTSAAPRQRAWAMAEYHGDRACTGTFMLRQERWKLIRHMGFASELYDLAEDPGEQRDLAALQSDVVARLESVLDAHFDCAEIDERAKAYDRESFLRWRAFAQAEGSYEDTMAHVFSGYDRQSIEELELWTDRDEAQIEAWLARAPH